MSRGLHARDHQVYVKRESDPQLGAKRPLEITRGLKLFYNAIDDAIDDVVEKGGSASELDTRHTNGVRLYKDFDPESNRRPTLVVFQNRLVSIFGRRNRIGWNMNDAGQVQKNIRDSIAALEKPPGYLPDGCIDVTFSTVIRPGSGDTGGKRKFAMIAKQDTDEAAYLVEEHVAVLEGLKQGLRGKSNTKKEISFTYGDFEPRVTLGIFDEGVGGRTRNEVIEAIESAVLPITLRLEPILLQTSQEMSLSPNHDYDL